MQILHLVKINLKNQRLLETIPVSAGSHDFSVEYVGVNHKTSQGKCKTQICSPRKCSCLAERHKRASEQTTQECSNLVLDSALLGPAGSERHAAQ